MWATLVFVIFMYIVLQGFPELVAISQRYKLTMADIKSRLYRK